MSASLVGSEMCIRDRERAVVFEQLLCFLPPLADMINTTSALGLKSRPEPVSYTHLTLPTICSV
eukprot:10891659-Alexandrium_andersonii.AAC.1